jgi:hypothetical protein
MEKREERMSIAEKEAVKVTPGNSHPRSSGMLIPVELPHNVGMCRGVRCDCGLSLWFLTFRRIFVRGSGHARKSSSEILCILETWCELYRFQG